MHSQALNKLELPSESVDTLKKNIEALDSEFKAAHESLSLASIEVEHASRQRCFSAVSTRF